LRVDGRLAARADGRLHRREVERDGSRAPPALLRAIGAPVLDGEAVEADAEEGAELGPRRIVGAERALIDRAEEEGLRRVFGVLRGLVPAEAQVRVDRAPVSGEDAREAALALAAVGALQADDRGELCLRKR